MPVTVSPCDQLHQRKQLRLPLTCTHVDKLAVWDLVGKEKLGPLCHE